MLCKPACFSFSYFPVFSLAWCHCVLVNIFDRLQGGSGTKLEYQHVGEHAGVRVGGGIPWYVKPWEQCWFKSSSLWDETLRELVMLLLKRRKIESGLTPLWFLVKTENESIAFWSRVEYRRNYDRPYADYKKEKVERKYCAIVRAEPLYYSWMLFFSY